MPREVRCMGVRAWVGGGLVTHQGGRKSGPRKRFAGKFAQFCSLVNDFSEFLTFPKVKNMRFLQKRVFFNFFDVKNAFNEI